MQFLKLPGYLHPQSNIQTILLYLVLNIIHKTWSLFYSLTKFSLSNEGWNFESQIIPNFEYITHIQNVYSSQDVHFGLIIGQLICNLMGYFCKQRITAKEKLSELSKQNKGTDGLSFSALRNFRNKSLCHSKFLCFWWLLTAILHRGLRNDFFFHFKQFTFSNFYLDFYFLFLFGLLFLLFPFSMRTFLSFKA